MVTNMDADAQVPHLYVQEVDRAAAAAEDPHLLVRRRPVLLSEHSCDCDEPLHNLRIVCSHPAIAGPFSLCVVTLQVYAAPILFERNAYDVPVFTRVHDFMWSGEVLMLVPI